MSKPERTETGRNHDPPARPEGTVFSDPRYVEAVSAACGLTVHRPERGGPLFVRSGSVILPPFTPFSGLDLALPSEHDIHAAQDDLAACAADLESTFNAVRLHLPPDLTDPRPLIWRGWRVSPLFTYVCNPAEGTAAWSESARRTARNEAKGYRVAADPAYLGAVIHLVTEGYLRSGRTAPASPAQMSAMARPLIDAGLAECIQATNAEGVQAGVVLLHGAEGSYYWMAGSVPGPAMTVLLADILDRLAARGVRRFDLVGANTPPIAEFKRRLGAQLVPYWAATFASGWPHRLRAAARALLRP